MKYNAILPAALALTFGVSGLANAQTATTTTAPNATTTTPGAMSTPGTMSPGAATTSPTAAGQNTPRTNSGAPIVSGTNSATNNAVSTQPQNNAGAPVAGANSFTQGEARRRIEKRGFTKVTALKLDPQGVWRGTAMQHGKSVGVSMDYQGNIVAQ